MSFLRRTTRRNNLYVFLVRMGNCKEIKSFDAIKSVLRISNYNSCFLIYGRFQNTRVSSCSSLFKPAPSTKATAFPEHGLELLWALFLCCSWTLAFFPLNSLLYTARFSMQNVLCPQCLDCRATLCVSLVCEKKICLVASCRLFIESG